jgi:hypothetical protein
MKRIFDLTKREQRIVILIVVVLVAIAFAKHLFENKSRPPSEKVISTPTASPTVHTEEEPPEPDDSR